MMKQSRVPVRGLLCIAVLVTTAISAHGLVDIQTINPRIRVSIIYATERNEIGEVIYKKSKGKAYLLREVAEQLSKIQEELEGMGLGLLVYDAYRPVQYQQICYDLAPRHLKRYYADPKQGGKHTRGTTVDCTIVDLVTGNPVSMPTGVNELSPKAWHSYEGPEVTDEVRANRALLRAVMEKHGFWGIPHEWWHYDYLTSVNGTTNYWQKQPVLSIDFDELD